MAITTYTELQAAITSRLHRNDLSSVIPDFIAFAEKRMQRELRLSGLESTDTITCVAGTPDYALPADFKAFRSVNIAGDPVRNLEYLTPETADKLFGTSSASKPYGYSLIGGRIYLFYTPDSDYTVNIIYYAKPTALSEANQTNYFITELPDALLYASMVAASTHIKDDNAVQRWATLYQSEINNIKEADQEDKWSGSNMRVHLG
jgi:hypothetical protein